MVLGVVALGSFEVLCGGGVVFGYGVRGIGSKFLGVLIYSSGGAGVRGRCLIFLVFGRRLV